MFEEAAEDMEKIMSAGDDPSIMITFKYPNGHTSQFEFYHLAELFKDFLVQQDKGFSVHAIGLAVWEEKQKRRHLSNP